MTDSEKESQEEALNYEEGDPEEEPLKGALADPCPSIKHQKEDLFGASFSTTTLGPVDPTRVPMFCP